MNTQMLNRPNKLGCVMLNDEQRCMPITPYPPYRHSGRFHAKLISEYQPFKADIMIYYRRFVFVSVMGGCFVERFT